jgi:hypothetical protein
MTAEAVQPTLDLGDYRGRKITGVKAKLANTNDGFDPTTGGIEGRIYEIGEELTVAVRVVVSAHNPKLVNEDGELELLQTFKALTMSVIPDKLVAKELNAVEKAQAEAKKAKEAKKPVRRANLRAVKDNGPKAVGESLQEALNQ